MGETHIEHFRRGRGAAAFRLEEPQIVSPDFVDVLHVSNSIAKR
ncbi:hypothetical protein C7S16_5143 [Burkholderia thailandensis]|uniref:Uncharacterized protein n=1 Tax=Burkholderia thailandensis TaxID=57975 RepID=A0AAW9CSG7_BURTH|nr:hypothetical protein [Burkholderia thailandensis]